MKISFVVCTYGRELPYRRLVDSIRREFTNTDYEIVTVASDEQNSEKCVWASKQSDIKLICVGDRKPNEKRQKSLYFYENLAINVSSGDWVFITNDDTEFMPGSESAFLNGCHSFEVLVIPAEIDDPALGKRAPIFGSLTKNGIQKDLYLLDFAFIKSSVMASIGPADEKLDWYGGGADRAILVALLDGARVGVLSKGGLTHHLEPENRTPPHSIPDFQYLKKKWDDYQTENPNVRIRSLEGSTKFQLPLWYYRRIWPNLLALRTRILSAQAFIRKRKNN